MVHTGCYHCPTDHRGDRMPTFDVTIGKKHIKKEGDMKGKNYFLLGCCFVFFLFISNIVLAVPGMVTYQGKLANPDGAPVDNGTYTIQFSIYDVTSGGTALWSETQSVLITDGVYNVTLGSVTPIPTDILDYPALYLGMKVEDDSEMIPRQEITSTFYALRAGTADAITESGIQTVMISDHAVTSEKIAPGAVTSNQLGTDAVDSANIVTGAVGSDEIADDAITADDLAFNYAGSTSKGGPAIDLSCAGCISSSEVATPLELTGSIANESIISGLNTLTSGIGIAGLQTGYGFSDFPSGMGKAGGFFGGRNGVVAVSKADSGKGVYGEAAGANAFGVYGKAGADCIAGYFERGDIIKSLNAYYNDDVAVEDHDAILGLYSDDAGSAGSGITLGEIDNLGFLRNKWSVYRTTGTAAQLRFTFGTDRSYANNPTVLTLDDSGYVGIGTSSPDAKITIFGDGSGVGQGMLSIKNLNEDAGIKLYDGTGADHLRHTIYNEAGTDILRIAPGGAPSDGISVNQSGRVGIGTGTLPLTAKLVVAGRTKTQELEITGGSDLSENFDISESSARMKPGMVLSIDPVHAGKLVITREAYDRKVAGIVSGAGSIRPGLLMGQKGTNADGAFPVAISGRVYCLADATYGSIQPGDLLTTSSTPGHAMKVTNYQEAQGAILGKAMSSLDKGKGLVLVLISMQ